MRSQSLAKKKRKQSINKDYYSLLIKDVHNLIFSYINFHDILRLRIVSKYFNKLVEDYTNYSEILHAEREICYANTTWYYLGEAFRRNNINVILIMSRTTNKCNMRVMDFCRYAAEYNNFELLSLFIDKQRLPNEIIDHYDIFGVLCRNNHLDSAKLFVSKYKFDIYEERSSRIYYLLPGDRKIPCCIFFECCKLELLDVAKWLYDYIKIDSKSFKIVKKFDSRNFGLVGWLKTILKKNGNPV